MKPVEILHRGSLMTYQAEGHEHCFGYLMDFQDRGIFEPTFGKLDVTTTEANTHNRLLAQGELNGLDRNCALGMCGRFYIRNDNGQVIVTTWTGEIVSREVIVRGQVITFRRSGMSFRGRLRQHEDCFHFKRIQ